MANAIHRTTLEYRASINTPDFPEPTWKHGPDMSAVAGVAFHYWKSPPDWNAPNAGPMEMTAGEKAAVDAASLTAQRDAAIVQLQQTEDVLRAFMLAVLDELNLHATKMNAILNAIDGSTNYATLKSGIAAVADYPARTESQLRTAIYAKLGS